MLIFEINNNVLNKIKVDGHVPNRPINNVIKIPEGVTEIATNVLDESCVGFGHYGDDYLRFRGILVPKTVKSIDVNAFNGIKINKTIEFPKSGTDSLTIDSEQDITLYFEEDSQLQDFDHVTNPMKHIPTFNVIYTLYENNPDIETWVFKKISSLSLYRNDNSIIELKNEFIVVSIIHKDFVIKSITIDNPWYGRRTHEDENPSEDAYIYHPEKEELDEARFRELFD